MDREERTERVVQQLFHIPAAGNEGTDPEFMRIPRATSSATCAGRAAWT
ncbi:MAG: hypothetical protein ACLUEK_02195 [Oscillospiraceae bacterium]